MKREGYIITREKVTKSICLLAIYAAALHKHKREVVQRILENDEEYAEKLRDLVLNMKFQPSKYTLQTINERGKIREITKPKFWPDQCVHHLLIELAKESFLFRIDPHACGSVPGRGIGKGIKLVRRWTAEHMQSKLYCLKADIRQCYPSLKPHVLMRELENYFKDPLYLELWRRIIYSWDYLPLGNYTSTFLLNLVFKPLDEMIRNYGCAEHYIRYIDDIVIFSHNKRKLYSLENEISIMLRQKYELKLKDNWVIFKMEKRHEGARPLDFIGYKFWRGGDVGLRKRNFKALRKTCLKFIRTNNVGTTDEVKTLLSRMGMMEHCNNHTFNSIYLDKLNIWYIKQTIRIYQKRLEGMYGIHIKQFKCETLELEELIDSVIKY